MTTPREVIADTVEGWLDDQVFSSMNREHPKYLLADYVLERLERAGFRVLPVSDQPRGEGE